MSKKATELRVVKLTARGLGRIPSVNEGSTFVVDSSHTRDPSPIDVERGIRPKEIIHVRDYRYPNLQSWGDYCVWSLAPGDYEEVKL